MSSGPAAPPAPTGLTATANPYYGNLMTVSVDEVPAGYQVRVDISSDGSVWDAAVAEIDEGLTSAVVANLTPETSYYIRVYTLSESGASPYVYVGGGAAPGDGTSTVWDPSVASAVAWDAIAGARADGRLWQNSGKTVAATADSDPVRVWTDAEGNDWTAPSDAARPLLEDGGDGKWSLKFDGVNDYLDCTTLGASTGKYMIQRLYRDGGDGGWGVWAATSSDPNDYYGFLGAIYCSFGTTARKGPITPGSSLAAWNTIEVLADATWEMLQNGSSIASSGSNTVPLLRNPCRIGTIVAANNFVAKRLAGLAVATAVPDGTTQGKFQTYFGAL